MPRTQDPFQRPTDDSGSHLGHLQTSKKGPPKNPTHLIQYQEPWDRLNSTLTVTSMRRGFGFLIPRTTKCKTGYQFSDLWKEKEPFAPSRNFWNNHFLTGFFTLLMRTVNEVPKDDLDFRLAALYDHHTGSFKNKCEILLQKETIQNSHSAPSSRLQFPGEHQTPQTFIIQDNIKKWVSPKKESIHSIQGSIVSPHTAATNGGYSRKNDGGFFST